MISLLPLETCHIRAGREGPGYRGGVSVKARARRELARVPGALALARLTVETIRVCLRYRVTGLASEAGFFMLLSLPPLLLGLFGGVGYLGQWLGQDTVNQILDEVQGWAEEFLTEDLIADTLLPTVQDVLETGRFDLISVGFLLSIWSGSRALNVFVDTISIMYGQSGVRGIVRTRALSLTLYFLSLLVGVIVIPLVVIGPTWLRNLLPQELEFLAWLYWPTVTTVAVASIATLFHISTPMRTPWLRDVPGGGADAEPVVPGVVRPAGHHPGLAGQHVDLRPAQRAHRPADLAVLPRHRHPHRRGPQRRRAHPLARRGASERPGEGSDLGQGDGRGQAR